MLPEATADLVRRDSEIPGLDLVLDGDNFAEAVAPSLGGLEATGGELTYVRYKRSNSCLVIQRLETSGGPLEVYAKAYAAGSRAKLAKATDEATNGCRNTTWILDGPGVVVRAFPSDGKLRSLRGLDDPERRMRLLQRVTERALAGDTEARLRRLAYKPERRFVARWGDGEGVFKFYRPEGFARAYRAARALTAGATVTLPKLIGRSNRHSVLAFEWLDGTSLRDALGGAGRLGLLSEAGSALADLHRHPVEGLRLLSRQDEISDIKALVGELAFLAPALAGSCAEFVRRLSSWLADQKRPWAAIHGDFYDKQLLARGDGVAFLDLDEAAIGDPRADLGNFVAHLERDAVLAGWSPSRVSELAGALVGGYVQSGGQSLDSWWMYVAVGLLKLAHHPFRSGRPDWEAETEALLERALAWAGPKRFASGTRPPARGVRREHRSPVVVSLNQDAGIGPERAKGAAVHLRAMRDAFTGLGAEVICVDQSDGSAVCEILEEAEREQPIDLIYERYSLAKTAGAAFAQSRGVPYVLEVNSPLAEEASRWRGRAESEVDRERDRLVFSAADAIVAVTQPVADYAIARGARSDRVRVWPNGVDAGHFKPRAVDDALRRSLVPEGRFALGFHGRLRPWHRFDVLVEVCRRLLEEGAPVQLVVVGEGGFREALTNIVPWSHRTLVPWQAYDWIARHVATFDVLPLTYTADQPFYFSPLKLAEAMACGVVPVVPALADLPELVRHGREGLVYPPGDVEALVQSIRTLIAEPARHRALGRAARERALSLSWERIADFVLGLAR